MPRFGGANHSERERKWAKMVENGEKWSKVGFNDQFGGIEREIRPIWARISGSYGGEFNVSGHSRAKARREGSLDRFRMEALRLLQSHSSGLDWAYWFAGAHDEVPDKQGRVTIPGGLRTYATLEKECVVIGANTRLEIWDATAWSAYLEDREKGFADVSTEVLPGLF